MKGLSLNKFKKVSEDKDWATLIHEDGHSLIIAKGILPHLQRKQLEGLEIHKMADGGDVGEDDDSDDNTDNGTPAARVADSQSDIIPPPGQRNPGFIQGIQNKMGDASSPGDGKLRYNVDELNKIAKLIPEGTPSPDSGDYNVATFDALHPGSNDPTKQQIGFSQGLDMAVRKPSGLNPGNQSAVDRIKNQVAVDNVKDSLDQEGGDNNPQTSPQQGQSPGTVPPQQQDTPDETAPIPSSPQEAAPSQPPPPTAPTPEQQTAALPTLQDAIAANQGKDQALEKAYATGAANPDDYVSSENNSKTGSWLGLIVSSLGQAVGGPNVPAYALDQLNKNTQDEIQRQKMTNDKNLNLWKMNRQALGTDLAANLATQNQINTGLQYKINKAAQESTSAHAMAQANEINQKIQMQKDANAQKLALLSGTSDNPDPSTRIPFLIPAAHQKEVADQMDHAKKIVSVAQPLMDAFDQAADEVNTVRGTIPYGGDTAGQKAFKGLLGVTIPAAEGGTNNKSLREGLEHNFTPGVGIITGDTRTTIATKRAALGNYLRSVGGSSLAKANGIDFSKFPATNTSNIGLPGGPGAPRPKIQPGVKYKKVIVNGIPGRIPVTQ